MKARAAEMRSDRRGKFQRRAQKHFLQRFSLRGVVAGPPELVMKKQRLIFSAAVVVFRGEDFSVSRELPFRIFLFLEHHMKDVTLARVGVEIQVIAKNLCQVHRELRGFAGLGHGVGKRIVDLAGDRGHFYFRRNFLHFGGEAALRRSDFEHAVGVDFVIDLAQVAIHAAVHGDSISGAYLPQIEGVLRGGGGAGGVLRAQPEFLQRGDKVLPCGNSLLARKNSLLADARRVFAGELSLALEFASGIQAQVKHVAEGAGAGGENSEKQEEEATRQISPHGWCCLARAMRTRFGSLPQEPRFCPAMRQRAYARKEMCAARTAFCTSWLPDTWSSDSTFGQIFYQEQAPTSVLGSGLNAKCFSPNDPVEDATPVLIGKTRWSRKSGRKTSSACLEIFHDPHVATCGPAIKCQMAAIGRWLCKRFVGTSGVFPQYVCVSVKIHMQYFSSVTDAGGNKQALSVRGPDQGQEIAPTLHLHLLQYLSVQGKNVDWACHGSSCGNPGTIRRESQSPILVIRNQSESKKLRASAF